MRWRSLASITLPLLAICLLQPAIGFSQEESSITADIVPEEETISIRPMLTIGGALLFENANDRRYQASVLPPLLGIGALFGLGDSANWSTRLEYSFAESRDGNSTVSVLRKRETWLLWLSRDLGRAQGWVPYMAMATGISRRDIETRLEAQIEQASGAWLGTASAAFGFRARWSQSVTAKLEFRYELGDAQKFSEKTNDARMGAAAMIETVF